VAIGAVAARGNHAEVSFVLFFPITPLARASDRKAKREAMFETTLQVRNKMAPNKDDLSQT
jgi:hypothetical protein